VHTHIYTGDRAKQQLSKEGVPTATGHQRISVDEMAEMYQRLNMMAVIFDVDQETRTGLKISNAETAAWVKKYSKTFIGFGSVDPWKGKAAVDEVGRRRPGDQDHARRRSAEAIFLGRHDVADPHQRAEQVQAGPLRQSSARLRHAVAVQPHGCVTDNAKMGEASG
jgi:hypothetical protein